MQPDLSKKIALVTGASRGIGAAIAKALAKNGAHVVLLARTLSALEKMDDEIRALGGQATLMPVDLQKIDELEALGPVIANRFGALDIFVGNAGILGPVTPVAHSKMKDWQNVFQVNLMANVQMIRTLDPVLRASPHGRAVFVTSGLGTHPQAYFGAYGASKSAIITLAQCWAAETQKTNLKINLVNPGPVDTAMLSEAFPGGYQGSNLRQPEDLVPVFLNLCSENCQTSGEIYTPEYLELASRNRGT